MNKLIFFIFFTAVALPWCRAEKLLINPTANRADWKFFASDAISWLDGGAEKKTVLKIVVAPERLKAGSNTMFFATYKLDLTRYKGKFINFSAKVKAEQVSRPSKSYLGIKFMFVYQTGNKTLYPDGGNGSFGTFDWRLFNMSFRIPDDIRSGSLCLGLQDCCGTVYFKDILIEIYDSFPPPVPLAADFRCDYSETLKNTPPLRGFMSPDVTRCEVRDIYDMAERYGANLIRWQIDFHSSYRDDLPRYLKTFAVRLDSLDRLLPHFEKTGIKVILDVHAPPGGRVQDPAMLGTGGTLNATESAGANFRMFFDHKYIDVLASMWEQMARRYKDHPAVWGYDLCNEPAQYGSAIKYDYLHIQYLLAQKIRRIDPEKPIFISANDWSNPAAFKYLHPLPLKNLIYQVHMYEPGGYTHQGVGEARQRAVEKGRMTPYPASGAKLVAEYLQPVVDFQRKYGARIFVGEVSTVRWAPDGARYLEDALNFIEAQHWDWTYHSYHSSHSIYPDEWAGFSLEHSNCFADIRPQRTPTDRSQVVRKFMTRNYAGTPPLFTSSTNTSAKPARIPSAIPPSARDRLVFTLPGGVRLDLLPIEAGSFTMGSPKSEVGREMDEFPHQVAVKAFYLSRTEVTQAQYEAVMGSNPSRYKASNLPVHRVTWDEAVAFCEKLNRLTANSSMRPPGYRFALPEEKQWEYACRAGSRAALANGAELADPYRADSDLNEIAWYNQNGEFKPQPVGTKKANAWGLADMSGNVSEWCADIYAPYPGDPVRHLPETHLRRVLRGGSFGNDPRQCRSAERMAEAPGLRNSAVGFRVALSPGQ